MKFKEKYKIFNKIAKLMIIKEIIDIYKINSNN